MLESIFREHLIETNPFTIHCVSFAVMEVGEELAHYDTADHQGAVKPYPTVWMLLLLNEYTKSVFLSHDHSLCPSLERLLSNPTLATVAMGGETCQAFSRS